MRPRDKVLSQRQKRFRLGEGLLGQNKSACGQGGGLLRSQGTLGNRSKALACIYTAATRDLKEWSRTKGIRRVTTVRPWNEGPLPKLKLATLRSATKQIISTEFFHRLCWFVGRFPHRKEEIREITVASSICSVSVTPRKKESTCSQGEGKQKPKSNRNKTRSLILQRRCNHVVARRLGELERLFP